MSPDPPTRALIAYWNPPFENSRSATASEAYHDWSGEAAGAQLRVNFTLKLLLSQNFCNRPLMRFISFASNIGPAAAVPAGPAPAPLTLTRQTTIIAGSLVPSPRAPPGDKRSGEQSRISWAYSPKRWKSNEIARSLIITYTSLTTLKFILLHSSSRSFFLSGLSAKYFERC